MTSAHWTLKHDVGRMGPFSWWQRSDGVYVWESHDYMHTNPLNPRCRVWMVFRSDQIGDYLAKETRRPRGVPRKWNTPEAAMRAADRELPLREGCAELNG